jgi:hypothetical protein
MSTTKEQRSWTYLCVSCKGITSKWYPLCVDCVAAHRFSTEANFDRAPLISFRVRPTENDPEVLEVEKMYSRLVRFGMDGRLHEVKAEVEKSETDNAA